MNNLDRLVLKDEIVTWHYYDETGQTKYHIKLLPKHLMLHVLHGTSHKHTGVSKMLPKICEKCYHYPGTAKHVRRWVHGSETCAKDKRVPTTTITLELLNLPDWDLGPEDATQIDIPNIYLPVANIRQ